MHDGAELPGTADVVPFPMSGDDYGIPDEDGPQRLTLTDMQGGPIPLGYDHEVHSYLSLTKNQIIDLTPSGHSEMNLRGMAPYEWYAANFRHKKAIDWKAAAECLMRWCEDGGVFDVDRIKGRGVHLDHGRVVIHLGNRLMMDGIEYPAGRSPVEGSELVYEAGRALKLELSKPLSDDAATAYFNLVNRCSWGGSSSAASGTKEQAILAAGWAVIAPICGILPSRPNLWVTGSSSAGKAQPHTSKVLTPFGWKNMGDLQVGDTVSTPDNGFGKILNVYPQGVQQIYRLTFADGRSARATGDHLWKVQEGSQWRLRTTNQLIAALARDAPNLRLSVPMCEQMELNSKKFVLPLHPYALGVLLGDGHLANADGSRKAGEIRITSADPEVFENVGKVLPENLGLFKTNEAITVRLGSLSRYGGEARKMIRDLRLLGTRSDTKFIPPQYLSSSISDRWELLRGLMDTDGTAGKNGSLNFSTVSPQLALDVQYLVRSLGGHAWMGIKSTSYTYLGVKKLGKPSFNIGIRLNNPIDAFSLTRKKARVPLIPRGGKLVRSQIRSIVPDGLEEASCISIDHPDRLYVTDDFVVTHNTWLLDNLLHPAIGPMLVKASLKTTEPGLRRYLRLDALPVAFNEAEARDIRGADVIQKIVELARASYDDQGAEIIMANGKGGSDIFKIRSIFAFLSIGASLRDTADSNRTVVVQMMPGMSVAEFSQFRIDVGKMVDGKFAGRLLARTFALIPTILENIHTLTEALVPVIGDRRIADTMAPLLAGYASLRSSRALSAQAAEKIVSDHTWISEHAIEARSEALPDHKRIVSRILETLVNAGGSAKQSIGELVQSCTSGETSSARDVLIRHGLRVEIREGQWEVWFARAHTELETIFRDTPWATTWSRIMRDQYKPELQERGKQRFGIELKYAMALPLEAIRG